MGKKIIIELELDEEEYEELLSREEMSHGLYQYFWAELSENQDLGAVTNIEVIDTNEES